jgi:hypothetical protein
MIREELRLFLIPTIFYSIDEKSIFRPNFKIKVFHKSDDSCGSLSFGLSLKKKLQNKTLTKL